MHISDGVLPTSIALGAGAASLVLATWSARRSPAEDLPKVAVVSAAFFVASLVHIPLGPTSIHLLLPGVVGALLGPAAFLAILLGLVLQSLLFQFGGLTALGGNALMMGLPALACGLLFQTLRGQSRKRQAIVGALCGGLGVLGSALIMAVLLALSGEDFLGIAKLALLAHLPVVVIEAIVAGFIVSFLARVKPELLEAPFTLRKTPPVLDTERKR
ncbi:MAG: cobalt transporter CbiM [Deltaproteobacteria bacterium]|nr:MAG: cobalt transporter CbiM [Deltaproteobacteria bacterium]